LIGPGIPIDRTLHILIDQILGNPQGSGQGDT
ncbi:MAG: hypothetical protein QOH78_207, partial [Verrucomicrobiota bacterium]